MNGVEHALARQVLVEALVDVVTDVDAGLGRSVQDRSRDASAGGERIGPAGVVRCPVPQERGELALGGVAQPHDAGVFGDVVELVDHPGLESATDAKVVAVGEGPLDVRHQRARRNRRRRRARRVARADEQLVIRLLRKDRGIALDHRRPAQRLAAGGASLGEAELVGQLDGDPLSHGGAVGMQWNRYPQREAPATGLHVRSPPYPGHRVTLVEEEAVAEVGLRDGIVVEGAVRKREEEKEIAAVVDLGDELAVPFRKIGRVQQHVIGIEGDQAVGVPRRQVQIRDHGIARIGRVDLELDGASHLLVRSSRTEGVASCDDHVGCRMQEDLRRLGRESGVSGPAECCDPQRQQTWHPDAAESRSDTRVHDHPPGCGGRPPTLRARRERISLI